MNDEAKALHEILAEMAILIERNDEIDPQMYTVFFQQPQLSFELVNIINGLDEQHIQEHPPVYSACIYGLDVCVAQLKAGSEANNKAATKMLTKLMDHLSQIIQVHKHSLSYWLPVLNAFYEVQVELNDALKNAYYELANQEDETLPEVDDLSHLDAIRDLIHELSDLNAFDIAENFFSQSYAMPPEFFADLVEDLYHIDEGHDIALLALLHPNSEARESVISTLDELMNNIRLSSISLSRLSAIKHWYPESYQPYFNNWIKIQRRKGVVFAKEITPPKLLIKATEIDGSGAQGLFIQVKNKSSNKLCGLLLKYDAGLKDVWLTPAISAQEIKEYYRQAFEESVTLREVDQAYLVSMVEHFMAISQEQGHIPDLHFLEFQELLGMHFRPKKLDLEHLIEQISVQISPFTQEVIERSLKRSKLWVKNKMFTESWYLESPLIDKIVNHNSNYVEGVKVCRLEDAMQEVFSEDMEQHRNKWLFHFLWVALWVKVKAKKNEKIWADSFLIAYSIHVGKPLREIPIMKEICYQTVINSVETMQERKTHLSKE